MNPDADQMPECDCVYCDACMGAGVLTSGGVCPECDSGITQLCEACREDDPPEGGMR